MILPSSSYYYTFPLLEAQVHHILYTVIQGITQLESAKYNNSTNTCLRMDVVLKHHTIPNSKKKKNLLNHECRSHSKHTLLLTATLPLNSVTSGRSSHPLRIKIFILIMLWKCIPHFYVVMCFLYNFIRERFVTPISKCGQFQIFFQFGLSS